MKRLFLMLKVLIPLLMVPSYLYAYDFNVDGIFYNIVKDNTVSVTYQKNRVETPTYKGDLIIPSSVSYNNTSYIVTYIGNEAFRDCKNLTSVSIPNSVISIGDEAFWYCSGLSDMIIPNSVTSIGKKALANCSNLASVTISSNATSLENSTFWGCSSLTSVTIPNSITSIDNYAFYECCNLTSLVIGNSVTSIGSYAFSGCKNITSVNLPNSVTSIGVSAFANCSNLASVSIPNSVTFIGGESFQLCSSLTSITIPNSVTDIGGSAFSLCSGLTTIISEIEKPFRISESTFSEETYNNAELIIPKGTGKAYSSAGGWNFKHIVEAGGVTDYTLSIKSEGNGNASYDGETIRNITKSFTITEGSNATIEFNPDYGYRIKSVIINSVDITSSISNYQYTVNNISANITVEVEFEAIPITTYTLSVKAAGNGSATYDGTIARNDIKAFTLNEGSSAIITFAPDNGYRIKSVKVNGADVMSSLSNSSYTISNINANTIVEVEFEVIPIPTYTLLITATGNGSATYYGTTVKNNTRSFTLNEGSNATITFAPDNGYRIKSVKVNNTDATSSVANNSYTVSNIKANTTVEAEFEEIPTQDTTPISGDKFEVDGITYVVNNDVNTVSVTSGNAKYSGDVAIPSSVVYQGNTYSVTSIGSWAFAFCDDLTSVTIPNSVTSIDMDAFQECSLNSITIPNSVTDIRFEAFRNCGLTSVTIPSSVRSIGYGAFFGCDLTTITSEIENPFEIEEVFSSDAQLIVPKGTKAAYQATVGWNQFSNIVEAGDDSTISGQCGENVYYSYDNKTHTLTISGEGGMMYMFFSEDYPWWSFHDDIQHIVIESGVTSIGQEAFWGCSGLTSITLPESLTQSNEKAFSNCKSLEAVYISDLEAYLKINFFHDDNSNPLYYAHHLFLNGKEIIDLVIPDGITHINQYAFVNGSSIKTVYVPNSVTSIGERAFVGCSALTSVTIPSSVTSIGECAFSGNNITSMEVESGNKIYDSRDNCNVIIETASNTLINGCKTSSIPNNVTSIGSSAFNGCGGLTSITIPNSVTSIGDHAFYGCSGLTSVVSEIEDPFAIDVYVFNGIPSDAQLIVPKGTKAKYQATVGWNKFTNIVEAGEEPDLSGQIHINDILYKVTGTGEVEVVSAENGVTSITIPSSVSYNNTVYKVTSIAKDAFENCDHLSAVIWEPEAQFNAKVNNPNFLLYVSDEKFASRSVKNVVVNGVAESIELTDAANGNDFYCPRVFSARNIVYSHNYQMETGFGDSRGWETIVLPFDVQKYTHATKGELESFTTWSKGSNKKPFWLFELTASGYKDVAGIKANTPYIISMPSNQQYEQQYQISGIVTFSASDVEVQKSDNLKSASYQGRTFVPNYTNKSDDNYLPLNVSNNYVTNPSKEVAGSKFIRGLRAVHPFEAYMTTTDNTRSIDVMDGMTTSIRGILMVHVESSTIKVYDTRGVLLKTAASMDDVKKGLKAGVYIVNGKKMIINK